MTNPNTNQNNQDQSQLVTSAGLIEQIMDKTRITPDSTEYGIAAKGVAQFIAEILKSKGADTIINKNLVDAMIVKIDEKIGSQVDKILHEPKVQELESSWRGLKVLVDKTDFRENIKIEILNVSKEELLEDFEYSSDITQSGLYKHVYSANYGQFGGEPVAAMIGNYTFTPSAPDIKLMQYVSSVGAMSHAPFIAAAGPEFFGIDNFTSLSGLKEIKDIFESPKYTKWRSLRESEDSKYLALTMPRFLSRLPYDPIENPVKSFNYREGIDGEHKNYLWSNIAFLLASRITDSFAKYRWCPNIIGPQSGGTVDDLPVHFFESFGQLQAKIPTEVLITDRKEFELSDEGFIPLTMRKNSDNAAFFSANSVQKPKKFPNTPEGKVAETNYKLGTQLPYMFIINRLAHYLKVLQREQIGAWKEKEDLERELNVWLKQYIADQENPPVNVRSKRPLRAARVTVSDVAGEPGWYKISMSVRPHFKYMGASFELSLVGRLDLENDNT
ncbi:type VI secretion system contractile sheath large subunit [Pasteurella atlantica]|uniref:Type VI secretion system contractile sheath large subunit n=2 Tax=Pasteurellaceae TaxID=712 RepID=A0ACC6HP21_9PAST|nr:type VI secretion system contractile sheath large subunit [Pasteurella atlantica]MDP8052621.1 type VI secretion system contractile sheath large subunit [Pasteurella atlantica]MDP8105779.1 type VI secretion system contractile sheath large subunit [Pasteurella atlantica]MDP8149279.1 type VI secretion system contractile sheath large subunit [Pasteurella atlantica]